MVAVAAWGAVAGDRTAAVALADGRMRALMVMNLTRRLGSYSGQDAVVSM